MRTLQELTVKEVYELDKEDPVIAGISDTFNHVIHTFSHNADLRGIFVVDNQNRFAGVITRTDLLDWARAKLGAFVIHPMTDTDKSIRLSQLITASTVGNVLHPDSKNSAVFTDDTLAQALKKMIKLDLIILPVIDEAEHILGSLTLSELLDQVLTESDN